MELNAAGSSRKAHNRFRLIFGWALPAEPRRCKRDRRWTRTKRIQVITRGTVPNIDAGLSEKGHFAEIVFVFARQALCKQDHAYCSVLKMALHTFTCDCGSESQIGTKSTENGNGKYLHRFMVMVWWRRPRHCCHR